MSELLDDVPTTASKADDADRHPLDYELAVLAQERSPRETIARHRKLHQDMKRKADNGDRLRLRRCLTPGNEIQAA